MFALPPLRFIGPRGTNAARGGSLAPAPARTEPSAAPAVFAAPRAAAPRAAAPIAAGTAGDAVADPAGLRVVPLRPDSGWPQRRAFDRVASPFRAFPYRSLHLTRMMSPADPRD